MTIDEAKAEYNRPIRVIVLTETIAGVTLISGEQILLDDKTSYFDLEHNSIGGISVDGMDLVVTLEELSYIIISRTDINGEKHVYFAPSTFKDDSGKNPWKVIDGRSIRPGPEIKFEDRDCKYDPEKDALVWLGESGEFIEVKLDDALEIKVDPSEEKIVTNRVMLGLSLVAFVIAILYLTGFEVTVGGN
jgi:hypothetical protein